MNRDKKGTMLISTVDNNKSKLSTLGLTQATRARALKHRKQDVSTAISSGFHADTLTNKTKKGAFHQMSLTCLLTGCMCQPFLSKTMLTNNTTDNFERRARNDRAMSNALHSVLVPQHMGNKKAATPIDLGLLT